MTSPGTLSKPGLTSSQIKLMAVLFMTIDHIAAYGFEIPTVGAYYYQLRQLGRIAAPLFLFMATEGVRHTRSRGGYILRLYLWAVGDSLFIWVTNILFGNLIGETFVVSILFDFFYLAVYITSIEQITAGFRDRAWKNCLLGFSLILLTCMVQLLFNWFVDLQGVSGSVRDLVLCFLVGPMQVQYSMSFVVMGVLMYFIRPNWGKVLVLLLFSGLCLKGGRIFYMLEGTFLEPLAHSRALGLFDSVIQSRMALAAPFMLLYNGQRGRGSKYFFYFYYPLHTFVIRVLVALIQNFI